MSVCLCVAAVSSSAGAQQVVPRDTLRVVVPRDTLRVPRPDTLPSPPDTARRPFGVRVRLGADTLPIRLPSILRLAERESFARAQQQIAAARATAFQQNMRAVLEAAWGQVAARTFATARPSPAYPGDEPPQPRPTVAERAAGVLADYADLTVRLDGRVELRAEQTRNARCATGVAFDPVANCRTAFEPLFDFQASLRSGGVIADRIHVDVDYDSQREFESSNNLSIAYEGRGREFVERVEIGNVSFQPPRSRFITSGIPSNNTGIQAVTRAGPLRLRAILAQQKGHVVRDRIFTVGDQALKAIDRVIEDHQFEPRRFFLTVNPRLLQGYPNLDLLDGPRMAALAASLPDTLRPTRLYVYRLLIGGQPPNPSGPQFRILGDPRSRRGQVYEYLREGVDYYADPSLLWIALVRPLALNNERLVVAYRVNIGGQETVHVTTGGTPDLEFTASREQFANLLWDPQLKPGDRAFEQEIRSVYRLGGSDVIRSSVSLKVVTGAADDQEKPPTGGADTYLELFGLAQSTNSSSFDVENRLWPRPTDANLQVSLAAGASRMIRDQFLFFPSVRPFARAGLTRSNPSNDTLYATPAEYLNTPRRPQTVYRMRARFQGSGNGESGTIMLGSVQLRPGSERVTIDGVTAARGVDYTVDYELGRVTFARPDTLFNRSRQVAVQFEERPLFLDTPTSIVGGAAEFLFEKGEISITALNQSQKTTFNRPPLGFEPASSLIAGVAGSFAFDAEPLTRLVSRLPWGETGIPSRVTVGGELAMSRPRSNAGGIAYLESFEGEGGLPIQLTEQQWYYSSQPADGTAIPMRFGPSTLDVGRAATMAWQSGGLDADGRVVTYSIQQIDPQTELFGAGVTGPEQLLWLTLYPLSVRGLPGDDDAGFRWNSSNAISGRRWRSIRTPLGSTGTDLTRVETIEFWAQIGVVGEARSRNPVLVLDFGDISENTLAFSPETLVVKRSLAGAIDSVYSGVRTTGVDRLDTERDPFSRAFNVGTNDRGLAGDVADSLRVVIDTGGAILSRLEHRVAICIGHARVIRILGDSRANCTSRNSRLDEEDVDADNVLNLLSSERGAEEWRRFVVDLADSSRYQRVGKCAPRPTTIPGLPSGDVVCWVFFRIPFRAPDDSLGAPLLRRTKALRVTMISSDATPDGQFTQVPIARLRLSGSPWLKRDERPLQGLAGVEPGDGFVAAGVIGTQDRNVPGRVSYESPPGVVDEPDLKTATFSPTRVQINERSLRLTAADLPPLNRAEAFYRFPEGQKNFMGYKELRLWARGIGTGWGDGGELEFFVRLGRDPSNFYLYRTALNGGESRAAWLPEIRVDFERFFALRAEIQNAFLGGTRPASCSAADSALFAAAPSLGGRVYVACSGGYIAYTVDPIASAPNLAAVQELAVGMMRVSAAAPPRPIAAGDTLELWVDDIRLGGVVDEIGFAGQLSATVSVSDFADIRIGASRRDPHFRQLGERPSYLTQTGIDLSAGIRLEKLLPRRFGLAIPLTVSYSSAADDPLFLSESDVEARAVSGLRTPRYQAASYSVHVRRASPLPPSAWGTLLNNLTVSSTLTAADARSEFQDGHARRFTLGADFNLSRALLPSLSRWAPAEIFLTSLYTHASDRRLSFLDPEPGAADSGLGVRGLTRTWRNGAVLSFRPLAGLTGRLDLASVRDLRRYDPTSTLGIVSGTERATFAGLDVGAEREREMESSLRYSPAVRGWIRPRFDFSSSYTMLRDPNTPFYARVATPELITEQRIPRRLANQQIVTGGVTLDVARAAARIADSATMIGRLARAFQPIDVAVNRTVVSAYEATAVSAPLHYQLAIGGAGRFRSIRGAPATAAAVNNQFVVTSVVRLPLNATLTNRGQRITARNWTRRFDNTQASTDGEQTVFPDIALRWSHRPAALAFLWSATSLTARWLRTEQSYGSPLVSGNSIFDDRGRLITTSLPVTASIVWSVLPGVTSNVSLSRVRREERRPGLDTRSRSHDLAVDVARQFTLPAAFEAPGPLRTRLSYQSGDGSNFVLNPLVVGNRSRVSDNGRRAWTFTADTDVSENLASSFVVSRVLSFDRNFDRRFTQTILSAVMHMRFYGGEAK